MASVEEVNRKHIAAEERKKAEAKSAIGAKAARLVIVEMRRVGKLPEGFLYARGYLLYSGHFRVNLYARDSESADCSQVRMADSRFVVLDGEEIRWMEPPL